MTPSSRAKDVIKPPERCGRVRDLLGDHSRSMAWSPNRSLMNDPTSGLPWSLDKYGDVMSVPS